jgi:hypothetical protein
MNLLKPEDMLKHIPEKSDPKDNPCFSVCMAILSLFVNVSVHVHGSRALNSRVSIKKLE